MKNYPTLHLDTNSRKEHYLINTTRSDINSHYYWMTNNHFLQMIQHYVIKFVSGLRQVGGFLRFPPVSSNNKTDRHDITEILLKVALNTIKPTNHFINDLIFNESFCLLDAAFIAYLLKLVFLRFSFYSCPFS